MKIKISGITDRGKVRELNEDALIACPDLEHPEWVTENEAHVPLGNYGALLVVADGVGGANAGERAAAIAIEQTKRNFTFEDVKKAVEEKKYETIMAHAFTEADNAIRNASLKDVDTMGMGTTLIMAWVNGEQAHVAWCGDSRCYLYNPKRGLRRVTKDHSYVQQLIDRGDLTEEGALTHPESNIITRGLGDMVIDHTPDFSHIDIHPGDMLLLCSDGLCGYCTDKAILSQLNRHCTDVDACVESLFDLAMNQGGYDNITILLLSIIQDEANRPPKLPFWKRL